MQEVYTAITGKRCTVRKFRGASRRQHKTISTRQLKNFNSADFINNILSIDWNGIVSNNDDVNLIVEQWTSSFLLILEKHAPLRVKRVSESSALGSRRILRCLLLEISCRNRRFA